MATTNKAAIGTRAHYQRPHQRKCGMRERIERGELSLTKALVEVRFAEWEQRQGIRPQPKQRFGGKLFFGPGSYAKP